MRVFRSSARPSAIERRILAERSGLIAVWIRGFRTGTVITAFQTGLFHSWRAVAALWKWKGQAQGAVSALQKWNTPIQTAPDSVWRAVTALQM